MTARRTDISNEVLNQSNPPSLEWLVSLKNPGDLWTENWFALVLEIVVIGLFIRACQHANGRGMRASCFLLSCFMASISLEFLQQIPHAGYQLWWYHQGMVNLLQRRVPLYIVCLMSMLYYYVDYINKKMNLPVLTQSVVNSVSCCMVLFPCLALAPNFLIMMVHFDDPVFYDRLLNVPHSQMAYSFLLFFHMGHLFNTTYDDVQDDEKKSFRYIRASVQSGMVSGIYSVVEVYLMYIIVKLISHLNTVFCFLGPLAILCFLAKDELAASNVKTLSFTGLRRTFKTKEFFYLSAIFGIVLATVVFINPENLKSNGERLEFGPCEAVHSVSNMSPLDIVRRRFICPDDTKRFGYDFHCVPSSKLHTMDIKKLYTLCGTSFPDHFATSLFLYSVSCLGVFYALLSSSTIPGVKIENFQNTKKVY